MDQALVVQVANRVRRLCKLARRIPREKTKRKVSLAALQGLYRNADKNRLFADRPDVVAKIRAKLKVRINEMGGSTGDTPRKSNRKGKGRAAKQ